MLIAAGLAVVYVTAPNPQVADSLATALVESRLAACVNILPGVKSVYRWQVSVRGQGVGLLRLCDMVFHACAMLAYCGNTGQTAVAALCDGGARCTQG